MIPGFAARYNVHTLVYYEVRATYVPAARREPRFKNWCRQQAVESNCQHALAFQSEQMHAVIRTLTLTLFFCIIVIRAITGKKLVYWFYNLII